MAEKNKQQQQNNEICALAYLLSVDNVLIYLEGINKKLEWYSSPGHTPWHDLCLLRSPVIRNHLKWIHTEFALSMQNKR